MQRGRQAGGAGGAGGEAGELGTERLGAPELVLEAPAPALGHVERVDQRREQAEVAEPQLERAEAGLASAATMRVSTSASSASRSGAANDSMPAWWNSRGCERSAPAGW